jgi:uncharacterized protein (TIGR04168 family)
LQPDAVLFVGDLSDGDLRLVKAIAALPLPTAVILGNHDHGKDASGQVFQQQLNLLGPRHCAWDLRRWDRDAAAVPAVSVLGARPGSAGGGYHLSRAITAVYGPLKLEESATRLVEAAARAPLDQPLVVLAHVGPSGLGSDVSSLCGRDWKRPAIDWGDQDLALALERIRSTRPLPLVVFGHMHHRLKRGQGERSTFLMDRDGTAYLNAACVPRCGQDAAGRDLIHWAWVEFHGLQLTHASHRWYAPEGRLVYAETLLQRSEHPRHQEVTPC